MTAPQRARIGPLGELLDATPELEALNERAGGRRGATVALPALERVARLARVLRAPIARTLVVGDEHVDLEMRFHAVPAVQSHEVDLFIEQVTPRVLRSSWLSVQPGDREATPETAVSWSWQSDAALIVTKLTLAPDDPSPLRAADIVGLPLTRLVRFIEDDLGDLPILDAMATGGDVDGQRAIRRDLPGVEWTLRAHLRRDEAGRVVGYEGIAMVAPMDVKPEQAIVDAAVTRRLQSALRGPLDQIIGRAESIGTQADGPLRRDYVDYAGDIARAGRHLLALVDDLADLEAIEDPQFVVAHDLIDVADIGRRAAGLLAVRASSASVRIDAPALGETLPAQGDFTRVLQIVVNLIGNAVRYSPMGAMIWVRCERDDNSAVLIVADQGKGIAIGDQARIFDKFERVEPCEAEGSGLGLYISRRLARAMKGDIVVDSAPGQGARFVLTLPAS